MMTVSDPAAVGAALRAAGAHVHGFGPFLVVSKAPHKPTVLSADLAARYLWHKAVLADPTAFDVRRMVRLYRHAATVQAAGDCGV
jgi:hypothetical protein